MHTPSFLRRSSLILGLATLGLAGSAGIASASHSWLGYHWARTSNPFTLKLGDNVSGAWDSYLVTTSGNWSASDVLDTTVVAGKAKGSCQPTAGRVEVCNKAYGKNGWLGIASVWVSGSHITQATVKMNDTYFSTATYNKPAWKNLVMCQEVGHTFGLDHQDENFSNANLGTCMDYTNDPDGTILGQLNNQFPNQHDYDEIALIYGHPDTTTTVSASVSKAANDTGDLSGPQAWGKVIKKDAHGHPSHYQKDLGNGEKVETFVIWAE